MRCLWIGPLLIVAATYLNLMPQDTGEASQPRFEAYCSRTEPGDSVAEVQWPLPTPPTGQSLSAMVQQQVLDVTVYKDGFDRGLFKTVKPGSQQPQFAAPQPREGPEIPGLQNLKLTQFATSQEQPKEGLLMLTRPVSGQESAVAKLEGLQPGMKYFVRVSAPDAGARTVSFTAAICPVDTARPPKK